MATHLPETKGKTAKVRRNYVGGKFVAGVREFPDINSVDGSVAAQVSEADANLVDSAVSAAQHALKGEVGTLWGVRERAAMLYKIADTIEARFSEFVEAEVADTGKPISLASRLDVPRAAANFRVFADIINTAELEAYQTETADGGRALNYAVRKPIGVVGIITPWNLPLLLLTWKVAPALACGNCVVVKPSEETPSTATLLAEVMDEVKVPAGVFNLVRGFGPSSAGEFLVSHPGVNAVTFTGESQTGAAIMKACAPSVKPVSFELGGKSAAIVFADCDFEKAVEGLSDAVFLNTGQVCLCSERVYVERPIFESFVNALKKEAEGLRPGLPDDQSTTLGPLISAQNRDKVLSYYNLARKEGATIVTGGGVTKFGDARDNGFYVEPTIMTGLPETTRCVKEEIFGPVCHIAPFDSEEEAVAMANATDYGLAASIWTTSLSRAHRVAPQMNTGITWVNCWFLRDLRTPFGGVGLSGIGREGGRHSRLLRRCTEIMRVLVTQFTILETMLPTHFLAFRGKLEPASGFQSQQFREIEFLRGLRDEKMLHLHDQVPAEHDVLARRLREPSLHDVLFDALRALGKLPKARPGATEEEQYQARADAIRAIYEDEKNFRDWIDVCERLTEFDELVVGWRLRHIQMVERTIGMKMGTGGSAGSSYLRLTLDKKFFPELWEARTMLRPPE